MSALQRSLSKIYCFMRSRRRKTNARGLGRRKKLCANRVCSRPTKVRIFKNRDIMFITRAAYNIGTYYIIVTTDRVLIFVCNNYRRYSSYI